MSSIPTPNQTTPKTNSTKKREQIARAAIRKISQQTSTPETTIPETTTPDVQTDTEQDAVYITKQNKRQDEVGHSSNSFKFTLISFFVYTIVYIILSSLLYGYINDKTCKFNDESKRKNLNNCIYAMWTFSAVLLCLVLLHLFLDYKHIKESYFLFINEKWTRSIAFFYQVIMFVLSILMMTFFSGNKCDDIIYTDGATKKGDNDSGATAMLNSLVGISSISFMITYGIHIYIDCNC